MFSGGDSSGEGVNFNNFRLSAASQSAAAACGIATNASIDWAQLAQQWIQMRDNSGADIEGGTDDAPPPPNISGVVDRFGINNYLVANKIPSLGVVGGVTVVPSSASIKKSTFEEKGEADMDMDEETAAPGGDSPPPPAPSMQLEGVTAAAAAAIMQPWFVQQGTVSPLAVDLASQQAVSASAQWNVWPPRVQLPPPVVLAQHVNPTAHIPSLMKIQVPNPNAIQNNVSSSIRQPIDPMHEIDEPEVGGGASVTMDAAKRKILPAWIREGLEKMEREKQRQMERQQGDATVSGDANIKSVENTNRTPLYPNELTVKNNIAIALESESSGNDDDEEDEDEARNDNIAAAVSTAMMASKPPYDDDIDSDDAGAAEQNIGKSYEQKLADLMIIVRRTLTELLLEVTNEEISIVAHEAIKAHKTKASSAQVIRKSALSTLTGKLGLAAYEDSSSDESSAENNDASTDHSNDVDSEEEIKASIRTKRRAFAKISEDIEERIVANAEREEQKLKYYTQAEQQQQQDEESTHRKQHDVDHDSDVGGGGGGSSNRQASSTSASASGKVYNREFGETTESKLQHSNGKRQRERSSRKERTSRFSDNKDTKSASLAAAANYISQMAASSSTAATNASAGSNAAAATTTSTIFSMTTSSTQDANGMYTAVPSTVSYAAASGMSGVLSAAEVALQKASKVRGSKSSSDKERRHRQQRRDGRRSSEDEEDSSSSSSSDSETTSASNSNSSHNSKYSRASSRHKSYKSVSSSKHKHNGGGGGDHSSSSSRYHRHSASSTSSKRKSERDRDYSSRDRYRSDRIDHSDRSDRGGSSRHRRGRRSSNSDDEDYYRSKRSRHHHRSRSRSPSRSSYSSTSRRRHR